MIWISVACILAVSTVSYRRYTDYNLYLQKWKQIVPQQYIHNVSNFSLDTELCYDKKCQYYYYQYEDKSFVDSGTQKTILFVSGMHGNQYIGPHTLLYAYQHLKAYRIIYFPMANPSGYLKGTRQTFPSKIDPNRDYPIDNNQFCYRTSSTHIIDFLFRKYKFDLTIGLHNGATEIGFNWGTFAHRSNSHTQDYEIYHDIGQMMKKVGGYNKDLNLQAFKLGTMDQVVYPAPGTFDDWAYAAGKFPDIITKCTSFQYEPYPKLMANGLVFLIEMGPFRADHFGNQGGIDIEPNQKDSNNGYVARGIRILKNVMNVIHPKVELRFKDKSLYLSLKGCRQGQLQKFSVSYQKQINLWFQLYDTNKLEIFGDLRMENPEEIEIKMETQIKQGAIIKYMGKLKCDSNWVQKGTTSFAQQRIFNIQIIERIYNQKIRQKKIGQKYMDFLYFIDESEFLSEYYLQIVIIIVVLFSCIFISFILKRLCKKPKVQKFQEVEFPESQQNTNQGEEEIEGDLHTARGGVINM